MENEQTLAVKLELINEKLNELINEQQKKQKESEQKNKTIMKKIGKMQEFNQIQEMRSRIFERDLQRITKRIEKLENKKY